MGLISSISNKFQQKFKIFLRLNNNTDAKKVGIGGSKMQEEPI